MLLILSCFSEGKDISERLIDVAKGAPKILKIYKLGRRFGKLLELNNCIFSHLTNIIYLRF
jgi:hypothetical protein